MSDKEKQKQIVEDRELDKAAQDFEALLFCALFAARSEDGAVQVPAEIAQKAVALCREFYPKRDEGFVDLSEEEYINQSWPDFIKDAVVDKYGADVVLWNNDKDTVFEFPENTSSESIAKAVEDFEALSDLFYQQSLEYLGDTPEDLPKETLLDIAKYGCDNVGFSSETPFEEWYMNALHAYTHREASQKLQLPEMNAEEESAKDRIVRFFAASSLIAKAIHYCHLEGTASVEGFEQRLEESNILNSSKIKEAAIQIAAQYPDPAEDTILDASDYGGDWPEYVADALLAIHGIEHVIEKGVVVDIQLPEGVAGEEYTAIEHAFFALAGTLHEELANYMGEDPRTLDFETLLDTVGCTFENVEGAKNFLTFLKFYRTGPTMTEQHRPH